MMRDPEAGNFQSKVIYLKVTHRRSRINSLTTGVSVCNISASVARIGQCFGGLNDQ